MNYPRRQYKAPSGSEQKPSTEQVKTNVAGGQANNRSNPRATFNHHSHKTQTTGVKNPSGVKRNYFSASPNDKTVPVKRIQLGPRPTYFTNPTNKTNQNSTNIGVSKTNTPARKRTVSTTSKSNTSWGSRPRTTNPAVPSSTKATSISTTNAPVKKRAISTPVKKRFSKTNSEKETKEIENKPKKLPPLKTGDIRVIPLGGVEEIGKNMTAIEYNGDIIVVDAGLLFPGEDAPGVDYIIPDTTYLEERKDMIRGVIITHGHLDHIGGIPYLLPKIGNPPIYTNLLTAVMIKKRQEEFPHLPSLAISVINEMDTIKLGGLKIRFFATTHTIPDSLGVIIETPYGNIICTGDFKIDHKNGVPNPDESTVFEKLGKEKNLLLMPDSTNVERPGFSVSEKDVQENIKEIIGNVKGRVIIGSFSSLFERLIYIIMACEELGKKVAVEGRSMKTNIEIAKELGLLKVKKGTLISTAEIDDYADDRIVILATGAQGDDFAALMRISQKTHKAVKIRKSDTILLSSSVIPGNERSVQKLKDNLARLGAKIIHYGIANVHSSGHSYQGELAWVEKTLKPKFMMPVHGHHHMLRIHADVGMSQGIPEKNIMIPDNGSIIEITDNGEKIHMLKETASNKIIMVDGLGTNNVKEIVIRDRQMLSEDGMFVLIAIIDVKTGKVRKSPDIISRGFIYLKESQDMLRHVRLVTKKTIEDAAAQMHPLNLDYLKNLVREELGKYLFQKTHKRPIILPVLIEV